MMTENRWKIKSTKKVFLNFLQQFPMIFGGFLWVCCFSDIYGAGTFYVDGANRSCSDRGSGTKSRPYCTISAAALARGGAGTTIIVKPAVYREQIKVTNSGTSRAPFVFQADGSPVVIDGADDFSSRSDWTRFSGNVWLASSVNWRPKQVIVNGKRLKPSKANLRRLPVNSFRYFSRSGLYVNIGGRNPGSRKTFIGRRSRGFRLAGKSHVTIDGFSITRTGDPGIFIKEFCKNIIITNNSVTFSNQRGIAVRQSSDILIAWNTVSNNNGHGIALTGGVSNSVVANNESFLNFMLDVSKANGLHLFDSSENLIQSNWLHDNQDSGQQINGSESIGNISVQNISWNNGDHGFDQVRAKETIYNGDVAWRNFRDGFSIEGGSKNVQIFNSIAIDNGLTTSRSNLFVDPGSTLGFTSDFNIFWNSNRSQPPIKYSSKRYASLADYIEATGNDVNSIEANPLFVDPDAGDFHLRVGSPAIDSADSSTPGWPETDAEDSRRRNVRGTPDTGLGSVDHADRGAFEFIPSSSSSSNGNLVDNSSFEINKDGWASFKNSTIQRTADGLDGTFSLRIIGPSTMAPFGIHDLPNLVQNTEAVGTRYRFTAWVKSKVSTGRVQLQVREFVNGKQIGLASTSPFLRLSPSWEKITVDTVSQAKGSTLDFLILARPRVAKEVVQIDDVSIHRIRR